MEHLINKLQECTSMAQADPILTQLNVGPAVKKLIETAIILSSSPDQQQRNHSYSFMESALQEIRESANTGSNQSSEHGKTYSNPAQTSSAGAKPMQGMTGTQNQMNISNMNISDTIKAITEQTIKHLKSYHESNVKPHVDNFYKKLDEQEKDEKNISNDIVKLKNPKYIIEMNDLELMTITRPKTTTTIKETESLVRPLVEFTHRKTHPTIAARKEITTLDRILREKSYN